ncbi:MAG: hypothetical protein FD170_3035 [Bacteroidetes bacterium]|nr:MAG: hypothetical protein FD170_3035 [Bacteroidota bacterium]
MVFRFGNRLLIYQGRGKTQLEKIPKNKWIG